MSPSEKMSRASIEFTFPQPGVFKGLISVLRNYSASIICFQARPKSIVIYHYEPSTKTRVFIDMQREELGYQNYIYNSTRPQVDIVCDLAELSSFFKKQTSSIVTFTWQENENNLTVRERNRDGASYIPLVKDYKIVLPNEGDFPDLPESPSCIETTREYKLLCDDHLKRSGEGFLSLLVFPEGFVFSNRDKSNINGVQVSCGLVPKGVTQLDPYIVCEDGSKLSIKLPGEIGRYMVSGQTIFRFEKFNVMFKDGNINFYVLPETATMVARVSISSYGQVLITTPLIPVNLGQ